MARFCVVITLAVCCPMVTGVSLVQPVPASVTRECSVERSGVLTMFNGQTSTVAVPCKYRLADIHCGDYQLVVTPGSKLDSNNTFSPDTVWVKILKSGLEDKLTVRTSSSRLQKFAKAKVDNPWRHKEGDLSSFGLDLAGYDSAKKPAVLRKDGVFEVWFNADRASVVVRCFSDSFSSTPQPDTLCGDGRSANSATKEEILDMIFNNTVVSQRPRPSCPRAATAYQECPAGANATRACDNFLLDQARVDCLASSGTPIIDHYRRCLETMCGVDRSALNSTLDYISHNCSENAGWLNSTCSADSDCPAAQSTCFEGLCLCTPGYYYSLGQDTCVRECAQSDLQDTFLKYPGALLLGGSLMTRSNENEEDCVELCRTVPACRSAVYNTFYHLCSIHNNTALDVPASLWITGGATHNTYQPICA